MSPSIEVVDTTADHIREMKHLIRQEDADIAMKLGMVAHRALWRSYKSSLYCRTAFINGKIGAIWGIAGIFMGTTGRPWLLTTSASDEYPMHVAFRYRQELKDMQDMFPELVDYVEASHSKSLRMLELMGFVLDKPAPIGKNGVILVKAVKKRAA